MFLWISVFEATKQWVYAPDIHNYIMEMFSHSYGIDKKTLALVLVTSLTRQRSHSGYLNL